MILAKFTPHERCQDWTVLPQVRQALVNILIRCYRDEQLRALGPQDSVRLKYGGARQQPSMFPSGAIQLGFCDRFHWNLTLVRIGGRGGALVSEP